MFLLMVFAPCLDQDLCALQYRPQVADLCCLQEQLLPCIFFVCKNTMCCNLLRATYWKKVMRNVRDHQVASPRI